MTETFVLGLCGTGLVRAYLSLAEEGNGESY